MLLAQNFQTDTPQHQRSSQLPLYQAPNSTSVRRSVEIYPHGVEGESYSGTGTHWLPSSSPLPFSAAFHGLPATAVPRFAARADSTNFDTSAAPSPASLSQLSGSANDDLSAPPLVLSLSPSSSDLMHHPDSTWLATGQLTPKSLSRLSHHHRESSLSSLGSAGPASPYSQNTSNPHIAVTDSTTDACNGLSTGEDYNYQLSKTPNDHFFPSSANYGPDVALGQAYATSLLRKGDNGMLPPAEYSSVQARSRPVSVASSVASESPAAPSLGEPEADRRRKNVNTDFNSVPKLDRTMTDIYSDELYSPHFAITSASPSQTSQLVVSPHSDIFNQRLLAANSQHLNTPQSPISMTSRGRSPFRQGSPLAPAPSQNFPDAMSGSQIGFGSAQRIRDQVKIEQDAHALQQRVARNDAGINTPQTISPKDAMLEYTESDSDANFPLFPQQHQQQQQQQHQQHQQHYQQQDVSPQAASYVQSTKAMATPANAYDGMGLAGTNFNFSNTQLPAGLQIPQQYPFISQARHQLSSLSQGNTSIISSPVSSVGSAGLGARQNGSTQRPTGVGEGGTYTCTYHGCTLRFETPALLQKHKREGHRQAHGLGGARRPEPINTAVAAAGMTSSLLNSQAGPHRCDRINPSTGKPCNTVFSRPYDLTRHEDTIHNARKQKVRCQLCTDEKTFSRADALTRHFRVCHPDVDLPGKHRRRHLQS